MSHSRQQSLHFKLAVHHKADSAPGSQSQPNAEEAYSRSWFSEAKHSMRYTGARLYLYQAMPRLVALAFFEQGVTV